jgi:hypothetical protein
MFNGQRDFRVIVVSSSCDAIEITRLVDGAELLRTEGDDSKGDDSTALPMHGQYITECAYLNPDDLKEVSFRRRGRLMYRYDFFVQNLAVGERKAVLFAIPFAKMARDFFSSIDVELAGRTYQAVSLTKLLPKNGGSPPFPDLAVATSSTFRIKGNDSANLVRLDGTDVIASKFFRRCSRALQGLELIPEKMRLQLQPLGTSPRYMVADLYGNFWIRVRKNGENIPAFCSILKSFWENRLLIDRLPFPVNREEDDANEY